MSVVADRNYKDDSQLFQDDVDHNNDASDNVRDHEHFIVGPGVVITD